MSRLQRSSVSFRRQGSSGQIWDATDCTSSAEQKKSIAVSSPVGVPVPVPVPDPRPAAHRPSYLPINNVASLVGPSAPVRKRRSSCGISTFLCPCVQLPSTSNSAAIAGNAGGGGGR